MDWDGFVPTYRCFIVASLVTTPAFMVQQNWIWKIKSRYASLDAPLCFSESFLRDEIQAKFNIDSRYNEIRKDILMAILHVSMSGLLIYFQQKNLVHNFPHLTFELNQHWKKSDPIWKWYLENCGRGFLFLLTYHVLLIFSKFYQERLTKGSLGTHSSVWICFLMANFTLDHLSH